MQASKQVLFSLNTFLGKLKPKDINGKSKQSKQTKNCFSAERRGTFEWYTQNTMTELHFKCCTSQSETFLQKNGFVIYFFNGVSKISAIIFHSQFRVEKKVMQNNFAFHESKFFFFKCPPLHISQINSSLDVKRKKKVLDNKRSEPLHITVS